MQIASGSWRLTPTADGTEVVHTYHGDPEIRVPAWLANRFVVDGPICGRGSKARRNCFPAWGVAGEPS